MSIKVGDRVRFLNDVGGGVVTKLVDRFIVMVENETGFDVPINIKEIVVIDSNIDLTDSNEIKTTSTVDVEIAEPIIDLKNIFYPETVQIEENGNNINVHLAFVPQGRPGNSDMDIYLINDSNYNILYSAINRNELNETYSNTVGMIEANTKEQIETIALRSVSEIPEYTFHLSFYKQGNFKIVEPVQKVISINPVRFYKEKAYAENDFFHEDSILIPIVAEIQTKSLKNISAKEIEKAMQEKEQPKESPKATSRKVSEQEILEVDLHIHELLDDFRGLSNGEILEIQMKHFNTKLTECLKSGPKKLVFIHGVGNGTLKTEVRRELDRKKKTLEFHDASFQEYGYGATMVKIR